MPEPDNLPPLRAVIAAHGLSAKKSLGQNFLLDLNLTRRIARAAGSQGAVVYEVGPGPGGLTRALLAEGAARVIAVERDARCLDALAEISAAYPGRLTIVPADAMAVDEAKLLAEHDTTGPVRIAANLPYNIGTALLVKWLTSAIWPPFWRSLTLMFQREVADRIVAKPGTSAYGRLSVLAQWRAQSKILFDVSRSAFVPPPKVTSAVLHIEPLAVPVAPAELRDLETVTAAAFGQRRKMLRQSLKTLTSDTEPLLRDAGIDPTERPEHLSVVQFAALARAWALHR
ncbi:MAG: 16S rRNA (adenine(1518)-N(6)/adenine(1519)-N(6))-dimethyltransferase RsmA [Alphaproteobacteria bacterium]|nr:16S rRNA (adenine(1518)-N(6)/adenine(1519)-N(6))-dimethyltransferase RsmA [Alphaproteobacteria bacterium]MDE2110307.1 16S rRNA (adenine(1518)-N(6)/adenine(1519)-N(6))-dimethyltransferase RsmA [Alphaproteobacteria bacterium]MDE2494846.1 16S rRNA (adenine(1518)-N(6)/adenine(1519)-N(6))-dimethyltransferase RsmA [Alphaproteobacteria bacterium]